MLYAEVANTARIIPTGKREHVPGDMRQWRGDSVGWWEGDTFVVETVNFRIGATLNGFGVVGPGMGVFTGPDFSLIERFSLAAPDVLLYEFTVTNPKFFAQPWTARAPMARTDAQDVRVCLSRGELRAGVHLAWGAGGGEGPATAGVMPHRSESAAELVTMMRGVAIILSFLGSEEAGGVKVGSKPRTGGEPGRNRTVNPQIKRRQENAAPRSRPQNIVAGCPLVRPLTAAQGAVSRPCLQVVAISHQGPTPGGTTPLTATGGGAGLILPKRKKMILRCASDLVLNGFRRGIGPSVTQSHLLGGRLMSLRCCRASAS